MIESADAISNALMAILTVTFVGMYVSHDDRAARFLRLNRRARSWIHAISIGLGLGSLAVIGVILLLNN